MADTSATYIYSGWSAAEIEADRALAAAIYTLGQADGLLNPALDPIFARAERTTARRKSPAALAAAEDV